MPNTYNEIGSGGILSVGQVQMLFIDYVHACSMQSATEMCCKVGSNQVAVTSKIIKQAWVAAITVCAQSL